MRRKTALDGIKVPDIGEHHGGSFGIYMAHKKAKLAQNFIDNNLADGSEPAARIFSGVTVYVNGYTDPPFNELKVLLGRFGGTVDHYLAASSVTHVIAQNLPDSKIKELLNLKRLKRMPVVYPTWITASIQAGKRLPEKDFLLPQFQQDSKKFGIGHMVAGSGASSRGPSTTTTASSSAAGGLQISRAADSAGHPGLDHSAEHSSADEEDRQNDAVDISEGLDADADSSGAAEPAESMPQQSLGAGDAPASAAGQPAPRSTGTLPSAFGASSSSSAASAAPVPSNPRNFGASKLVRSAGTDPNFMQGYFNSSRLHFIGSWRSHVQTLVAKEQNVAAAASASSAFGAESGAGTAVNGAIPSSATTGASNSRPGTQESDGLDHIGAGISRPAAALLTKPQMHGADGKSDILAPTGAGGTSVRLIAHIDIDCFFAQVALLDKPHLRDKPVAVAHAGGRPSGTSYAYRAFGDGMDTTSIGESAESRENVASHGVGIAGVWTGAPTAAMLPNAPSTTMTSSSSAAPGPGAAAASSAASSSSAAAATKASVVHDQQANSSDDHEKNEAARKYSGGEISSANYPARKFGIHAGMSVGAAKQLCPDLVVLPYAFDKIQSISEAVYRHFMSLTPRVQALSCDEAYLDLSGIPDPVSAVAKLRADIFAHTGCTVSAGIGKNMLLSRIATGKAKPDGLFVVPDDQAVIQQFIAPLKVTELPGIGWSNGQKMADNGVFTIGDLQKVSQRQLEQWFGPKTGDTMYKLARGNDERQLQYRKERKSIGAEVNWGVRFADNDQLVTFVKQLAGEVSRRMIAAGAEDAALAGNAETPPPAIQRQVPHTGAAAASEEFSSSSSAAAVASVSWTFAPSSSSAAPVKARSLTYKLMVRRPDAPDAARFMGHGSCDVFSRSVTLAAPTCDAEAIANAALRAHREFGPDPTQVRGLGIQMTKLVHPGLAVKSGPLSAFLTSKTSSGHSSTDQLSGQKRKQVDATAANDRDAGDGVVIEIVDDHVNGDDDAADDDDGDSYPESDHDHELPMDVGAIDRPTGMAGSAALPTALASPPRGGGGETCAPPEPPTPPVHLTSQIAPHAAAATGSGSDDVVLIDGDGDADEDDGALVDTDMDANLDAAVLSSSVRVPVVKRVLAKPGTSKAPKSSTKSSGWGNAAGTVAAKPGLGRSFVRTTIGQHGPGVVRQVNLVHWAAAAAAGGGGAGAGASSSASVVFTSQPHSQHAYSQSQLQWNDESSRGSNSAGGGSNSRGAGVGAGAGGGGGGGGGARARSGTGSGAPSRENSRQGAFPSNGAAADNKPSSFAAALAVPEGVEPSVFAELPLWMRLQVIQEAEGKKMRRVEGICLGFAPAPAPASAQASHAAGSAATGSASSAGAWNPGVAAAVAPLSKVPGTAPARAPTSAGAGADDGVDVAAADGDDARSTALRQLLATVIVTSPARPTNASAASAPSSVEPTGPVFAEPLQLGAFSLALESWMRCIGPHPAPSHAILFACYGCDLIQSRRSDEAVKFLRCVNRVCGDAQSGCSTNSEAKSVVTGDRAITPPDGDDGAAAVAVEGSASSAGRQHCKDAGSGATWADLAATVQERMQRFHLNYTGRWMDA